MLTRHLEYSAPANAGGAGAGTQDAPPPEPSMLDGTGGGAAGETSQQTISVPLQRWKKQGPIEEPYNGSLPRGN